MDTQEDIFVIYEKLNTEATKTIQNVENIKKEANAVVCRASTTMSTNLKQTVTEQANKTLSKLIEKLRGVNSILEQYAEDYESLTIPYISPGNNQYELKFLVGDDPWNFWLSDDQVPTRDIHKRLLKKYQHDLLKPYSNGKPHDSVCFYERNKVLRGFVLQIVNENRLKVLDCDSYAPRVADMNNVYEVDVDACASHASAIKCTISKDTSGSKFWKSDLRDIFTTVLKESILQVRILERLPGTIPSFLVDIDLLSEDNDSVGNLNKWIMGRLLPELNKLTPGEDSVIDFLSSEVLDPYFNISHCNEDQETKENNINSSGLVAMQQLNSNIEQPVEENNLNSSGPTAMQQINLNVKQPFQENNLNSLEPTATQQYKSKIELSFEENNLNTSRPTATHQFNSNIEQSDLDKSIPEKKVPGIISNGVTSISKNKLSAISATELSNIDRVHAAVNVMAPEFIPSKKIISSVVKKPDVINKNGHGYSHSPPLAIKQHFHVELRKPSSLLQPGEKLLVIMAHVKTPFEFYVHFVSNNNKYLDKLLNDMVAAYERKEEITFSSWHEAKAALGKFCACKWLEDKYWYRVEVLDWALGDNQVKVFFVDFGNTESVPIHCLQPLLQQYTKLSMCAQQCHLANVYPLTKQEEWSQESVQFFKSKAKEDSKDARVYTISAVPSSNNKIKINSLSVLLYEGNASTSSVSINEQMVDFGFAWSKTFKPKDQSAENKIHDNSLGEIPSLSYYQPGEKENGQSFMTNGPENCHSLLLPVNSNNPMEIDENFDLWDPQSEEYCSSRNNPRLDTDDACVAVTGYSAKDEVRICKFYARNGICRKNYCDKEHSKPNKDGITTDKEMVYNKAFSEITLPDNGEIIYVKVTAVADLCLFYVQLKESVDYEEDEDIETLTGIIEYINEDRSKLKYLIIPPALGQLVLAENDNYFYRARVIEPGENDCIEVMFVDYGTTATVTMADIREMEPQYLHLPLQAIECSLANIKLPGNKEDFNRGSELLKERIEGRVVTAKVISRSCDIYDGALDDHYGQSLQVLLEDDEGDIGDYLIEQGCADPI